MDVDDDNADLKTIEQELIEDIKSGAIKHNPEGPGNGGKQQHQLSNTQHQAKGHSEK